MSTTPDPPEEGHSDEEREDEDLEERARARARERIAQTIERAEGPQWYGAWTLLMRELRRFWGVAGQTIISPVVTTLLYFLVFGYSLGDRLKDVQGVPYVDFLVPGLVMLSLINNAFINSAFSLFIAKIHGIIIDILVTPLSYLQLAMGYVGASIARAMLVGGIIWGVALLMGAQVLHHVGLTLVFMILTAMAFGLLGLMVAILAEDFDHVNLLPNFLITPLTFLGGVFYSIEMLPSPWDAVSRFNPILYMVNGLRYGMTGYGDVPPWQGLALLVGMNLVLGVAVLWLLRTGYKLRE